MFNQIYPEGESRDNFDIFYLSFLLGITNFELARKIQENNPKNLIYMRSVCVELLDQIREARRLGLSPGHNPKENFEGRFQTVKKTFSKQNSKNICFHCNKEGHKRPECEKCLAEKAKRGHIMKIENQAKPQT